MKYRGAWYREDLNHTFTIEFKPNPNWQPYERDQKAIEFVHQMAEAEHGFFAYVHVVQWHGLRIRCLTHRPLKGFAIPWTPHRRKP